MKTPSVLYHYTSQQGFYSIFTSRSMWASKIQFMSDHKELSYGLSLAREVFGEIIAAEKNEERKEVYQQFADSADYIKGTHIFVACFSEKKDSLSQWRSYCPNGAGYSIGFSSRRLREAVQVHGCDLVKCVYNVKKQKLLPHDFFSSFLLTNADSIGAIAGKPKKDRHASMFELGEAFRSGFLKLAPIFKHSSFKEEAEWRLISKPTSYREQNFQFRPGRYAVIPYLILTFGESASQVPVIDVMVGPNPHQEAALESARWFLMKTGVDRPVLGGSKVPFREL